jgi:type I restriction-modification system DNA methylase subunit
MATIAKYNKEEVQQSFSHMLALLIMEMEERKDSDLGNDVLGEFYELSFCRKGAGQFFTPWPICQLIAKCQPSDESSVEPKRVLDPTCGSGRMLLAGAQNFGSRHWYYGIDIDHTCVKMAALNLFLNGIFNAEVMCADALSPTDFRMSYKISFLPFGIYRIEEKERSRLWHMHQATFPSVQKKMVTEITLPSKEQNPTGSGSQLQLF